MMNIHLNPYPATPLHPVMNTLHESVKSGNTLSSFAAVTLVDTLW
jgi:hypothetical protein